MARVHLPVAMSTQGEQPEVGIGGGEDRPRKAGRVVDGEGFGPPGRWTALGPIIAEGPDAWHGLCGRLHLGASDQARAALAGWNLRGVVSPARPAFLQQLSTHDSFVSALRFELDKRQPTVAGAFR